MNRFFVVTEAHQAGLVPAVNLFDLRYHQHPWLTYLHIVPGVLFFSPGSRQFVRKIGGRWLNFHRWSGRIYLVSGTVSAVSAMLVAARFPASGGAGTAVATYFFGLLFLVCLAKAYWHVRSARIQLHREWMIRGFAIGLGVSTLRVILVLGEVFIDLPFVEAFPISVWLGFSINTLAAEVWVNLTRPSAGARPVLS